VASRSRSGGSLHPVKHEARSQDFSVRLPKEVSYHLKSFEIVDELASDVVSEMKTGVREQLGKEGLEARYEGSPIC
jgi:hypothetical protein